jgi:hypothetical protein
MGRTVAFFLTGVFAFLPVATVEAQPARQQSGQQTNPAAVGAKGGYNGGIPQTPWFSDPTVRQQLNLN